MQFGWSNHMLNHVLFKLQMTSGGEISIPIYHKETEFQTGADTRSWPDGDLNSMGVPDSNSSPKPTAGATSGPIVLRK